MKMNLLRTFLEHPGEWVSGEDLSKAAGVSRTSVWKHIRQLKAEGYDIESAPSKGYRLQTAGEVLSREELLLSLKDSALIRDVILLKSVDSTSRYARNLDRCNALVLAEEQTQGRGRLGRNWSSPEGQGLWFTLSLRPDLDPSKAALVTQIAAAAVWTGIGELTGVRAEIKWPNDILIDGRKVCGILTEMTSELGAIDRLMVGIGINVNIPFFEGDLAETAVSLEMATGRKWSRKALLLAVLRQFEKDYQRYEQAGEIAPVLAICRAHSSLLGKPVRILRGAREDLAEALDISPAGELLVRLADGTETALISGEVSVRKIDSP